MSYDHVGVDQFITKLKDGRYSGAANAQRAVGKSSMADADKAKCYRAIEKHFPKDGSAPPAPKAVKAAKKKSVAAKKKKAAAPTKAKKKKSAAKKKATKKAAKKKTAKSRQPQPSADSKVETQGKQISLLATAIDSMKKAKEVNPKVDVGPGPQSAVDALGAIIDQIHNDVRGAEVLSKEDQAAAERLAKSSVAATGIPNGGQPADGEPPPPVAPGFGTGVS
jgi:hypothetical protein